MAEQTVFRRPAPAEPRVLRGTNAASSPTPTASRDAIVTPAFRRTIFTLLGRAGAHYNVRSHPTLPPSKPASAAKARRSCCFLPPPPPSPLGNRGTDWLPPQRAAHPFKL